MPSRIIREGLIDSERINQLSCYAEVFFTRLILKADDYGCYMAHRRLLVASLYPLKTDITTEHLDTCIAECVNAGLISEYEDAGKKYLFIHAFKQRVRLKFKKWPAPPEHIYRDDDERVPDARQTHDRHMTGKPDNKKHSPECPPESRIQNPEYRMKNEEKDNKTCGTSVPPDATLKRDFSTEATRVLDFMNKGLKTSYRLRLNGPGSKLTSNADLIIHRLKDGFTPEDLIAVYRDRAAAWFGDDKMRKYLRPETLFLKSKFEGYFAQIGSRLSNGDLDHAN